MVCGNGQMVVMQGGIAVQDIDKLKEELKEGFQCEYMHLHLLPMCSC